MIRKILTFSILCIFALVATESSAQTLSKAEKKALKKEIKAYKKDPAKWKKMKAEHKEEVSLLNATVDDLRKRLDESRDANNKLENTNIELSEKLGDLENQYLTLKKNSPSTQLPMGTVYQVQMGYYQYLDLVSFNEKLKVIKAEEVDGAKRYIIGHFDNLLDAAQFSNDIKKLGIEDAFVTQYIDGMRNIDFDAMEVLEQP